MVVGGVRGGFLLLVAATAISACQPGGDQLQSGEESNGLSFGADLVQNGIALTEVTDPAIAEFGPLYVPTQYVTLAATAESNPQLAALWRDSDGDGVRDWTVRHEVLFGVSFEDENGQEQFWTGLLACRSGDCRYAGENLQEYAGVYVNYEDTLLRQDPVRVAARTGSGTPRFLASSWFTEDNMVCMQVNYLSLSGQISNYTNCGAGIMIDGRVYVLLTRRPGGIVGTQGQLIQAINLAVAERQAGSS